MENLPNREKNDSILTERTELWDAKLSEVKNYKDIAGNEMDEGIIETVAGLNLLGIPTTYSCSGHIERNTLPYIQFNPLGRPKGIFAKKSDVTPEFEEWLKKREILREKVEQLLVEYNQQLKNNKGLRMILDISSNIRFTNEEIEKMFERDPDGVNPDFSLTKDEEDKLKELVPVAQEEMKFFTDFLKEKYLKV